MQLQQGEYGEIFVQALATAAGLISNRPWPDRDGIDLWVKCTEKHPHVRSPQIDLQVKTWSRPQGTEHAWRYNELRVKHFNNLAGPGFHVPRFLVLVIVPPDRADWAHVTHDATTLAHAAYWVSLESHKISERDPESRITVSVPRANLLDGNAFHRLFGYVGRQGVVS